MKSCSSADETSQLGAAQVTVRRVGLADLEILAQLERESQRHPWPATLFKGELENLHSRIDLLFIDDQAAGYLCYHLLLEEISIINLAVAPRFRRRGVARRLLENALFHGEKVRLAFLEVRIGNAGAIALYRSCGFRESGVRKAYYGDGEDALLMEWIAAGVNNH
ncbi:MAG: ribosomal protein S18-alanine N-acetyltransferase [Deltaproteobacteria bacterium]|nr:ribosomal protein S18-alanine N-acetyltransferase [Deltaproteobacteria bacterium]